MSITLIEAASNALAAQWWRDENETEEAYRAKVDRGKADLKAAIAVAPNKDLAVKLYWAVLTDSADRGGGALLVYFLCVLFLYASGAVDLAGFIGQVEHSLTEDWMSTERRPMLRQTVIAWLVEARQELEKSKTP